MTRRCIQTVEPSIADRVVHLQALPRCAGSGITAAAAQCCARITRSLPTELLSLVHGHGKCSMCRTCTDPGLRRLGLSALSTSIVSIVVIVANHASRARTIELRAQDTSSRKPSVMTSSPTCTSAPYDCSALVVSIVLPSPLRSLLAPPPFA